MSQLLQLFALLAKDGTVPMVDGSIAPTGVVNGIPYDGVSVAVSFTDPISYYHQGLPFTAEGRVAIVDGDAVDHYGSGAAPIAANGRLIIAAPVFDAYMAVPYRLGRIVASEGTDPPDPGGDCYNFNSITEDQDAVIPMWNPSTVDYEIKLLVQYDSSNLFNYVLASEEDIDGLPGAFDLAFLNDNAGGSSYVSITVGGGGIAIASTGSPPFDPYGYIGDYANGELLDITVTMGAEDSYSPGFQGLAVINGVEYPFPNVGAFVGPDNQGIVFLGGFGGSIINGVNTYYVGVISDVYFTDFADPSNSRYYPIHEGTGSTFISQPAGNNIEITNHVVANWVDCPVVPAGDCYDFNSITQNQLGVVPEWVPTATTANDFSFVIDLEFTLMGPAGSLGYLFRGIPPDVDDNGDPINPELLVGYAGIETGGSGVVGIIFNNTTGIFIDSSNFPVETAAWVEGQWLSLTATIGPNDSQGAGFCGTLVVDGLTALLPNATGSWWLDNPTRGIRYLAGPSLFYEGIIRELYLTDVANPANSRYYPIDEGAGDTFVSQPAGNNTVVTNHLPANWVECPPDVDLGVTITTQPADTTAPVGGTAVFTVAATSGDGSPLTYQWQYSGDGGNNWGNLGDSANLSGTTTDTVTLINFDGTDLTQWRCAVSNDVDTVTSDAAILYALAIIFDAPLQDSLIPEFSAGSSTPTFQRASVAYVTDYQGTLIPVLSGEARFQGARRVENIIRQNPIYNTEDLTSAVNGGGIGSITTTILTYSTIFGALGYTQLGFVPAGDHVASFTIRSLTGTGQFKAGVQFSGAAGFPEAVCTTTSQRISVPFTLAANQANMTFVISNSAFNIATASFEILNVQIELNTPSGVPSEYVSAGVLSTPWHGANVDGVQYFTTENNSYVDNGVVTEVYDTPITSGYYADAQGPYGYMSESGPATNQIPWSEALNSNAKTGATFLTVTDNATISPDGSQNASSIVQTAAGSSVIHDATYTGQQSYSVWLKNIDAQTSLLQVSGAVDNAYQDIVWTGSVPALGAVTAEMENQTLTPYPNDWYLFEATTTTTSFTRAYLSADYQTASAGLYAWGWNVVAASRPSSYIKTAGATASRQADVLWYAGASNINYTEGTANVEMTAFWDNSPNEAYLLTSGTSSGRIAYNFSQDLTELRQFNGNILTVDNLSALPNVMQYVSSQWGPGGQYLKYGFSSGSDVNTDPMGTGDLTVGVSYTKTNNQWNGTMRGLEVYSVEGETILIPPSPPAGTGQANFRNGDEAEFRNTDNVEFI